VGFVKKQTNITIITNEICVLFRVSIPIPVDYRLVIVADVVAAVHHHLDGSPLLVEDVSYIMYTPTSKLTRTSGVNLSATTSSSNRS
jgi:hypothetical protein